MNPSNNNKISFSGLNEIRALAALAVVFHHLELFKKREEFLSILDNRFLRHFISRLGHNGVILFFTLSGFLITYLLLNEKKKIGFIDIKSFYIRRILRIWPVYFLVILVSFFILPYIRDFSFFENQKYYPNLMANIDYKVFILFVLFLSNFALIFYKPIAGAAQSWSVSVEEQFYILWPWIVNKIAKIKVLFIVLFAVATLKPFAEITVSKYYYKIGKMIHIFPIEYMCIGALFSILLFSNKIPLAFFKYKKVIITLTLALILFLQLFYNFQLMLSILFGILILLISQSKFKSKPLFYLGKISYGIYMYHPFIMFICFSLAKHLAKNELFFNAIYYSSTILFTILISHLSYYYFESKFLNFKHKFTKIESGA